MLRSDSAEWIDPAFPTTRARAWFLQHLPGGEKGHPTDFDRNRRPVPVLATEPKRKMGCSDSGCSRSRWRREPAQQVRGAVLSRRQTEPSGRRPESPRTSPHPGCDWGKGNDSPHLEYKQRWVNQYDFYVN